MSCMASPGDSMFLQRVALTAQKLRNLNSHNPGSRHLNMPNQRYRELYAILSTARMDPRGGTCWNQSPADALIRLEQATNWAERELRLQQLGSRAVQPSATSAGIQAATTTYGMKGLGTTPQGGYATFQAKAEDVQWWRQYDASKPPDPQGYGQNVPYEVQGYPQPPAGKTQQQHVQSLPQDDTYQEIVPSPAEVGAGLSTGVKIAIGFGIVVGVSLVGWGIWRWASNTTRKN